MKETIRFASGHQGGVLKTVELDLTNKEFSTIILSPDILPFGKFEVVIKTEGAVAIGTPATISEGPTTNISSHTTLGTIALVATGVARLVGTTNSSFIAVQLPTLPAVGKVKIYITCKD